MHQQGRPNLLLREHLCSVERHYRLPRPRRASDEKRLPERKIIDLVLLLRELLVRRQSHLVPRALRLSIAACLIASSKKPVTPPSPPTRNDRSSRAFAESQLV